MYEFPNDKMSGWFAACLSREIDKGQEKTIYFHNKPLVLSRSLQGQLTVSGKSDSVLEQNDMIFLWAHPAKISPTWMLPSLDMLGWTRFLHHRICARTHPQEVFENSIDVTHFSIVHNFHKVEMIESPYFPDHTMLVKHRIKRKSGKKSHTNAEFEVFLHGIGCAYNYIVVPAWNVHVRMIVCATPAQGKSVNINIAVAIQVKGFFKKMVVSFIHRNIAKKIINDFSQDIVIWENKKYLHYPLLVKGDGQIIQFRKWCKQFYYEGA